MGAPRPIPRPDRYSAQSQARSFGPKFDRLAEVFGRDPAGLELTNDPHSLAPERIIVFEVRGSVQNFATAVRRVPGLELIDEEELEGDEFDKEPVLYLLVPDAAALRQLLSLWKRWVAGLPLGKGFAPWENLFGYLRDVRTWGPRDRLRELDQRYLEEEVDGLPDGEPVRIEVEITYSANAERAAANESQVILNVRADGGAAVSRCYIADISYHAVLLEVTAAYVRRLIDLSQDTLAGSDAVLHIRAQSTLTDFEAVEPVDEIDAVPAPPSVLRYSAF